MSFVNLLESNVWTDADITNRSRSEVASIVSEARQNELRTIMLGHLAGMRTASESELAEIATVQAAMEAQVIESAAARADMALLLEVMAFEADPTVALSPAAQAVYDLRHPIPVETLL